MDSPPKFLFSITHEFLTEAECLLKILSYEAYSELALNKCASDALEKKNLKKSFQFSGFAEFLRGGLSK